jgi:hypothetical protein
MATARGTIVLFAAGVLVAALLAPAPVADAQGSKMCCFNNWRFSGTCVVQIAWDQQCGDVLSVLNNPMAAATSYCGGTTLRGGWTSLECGGGGSSTSTVPRDTSRSRPPETLHDPPTPSTVPDARSPNIVVPEETYQGQRGVQSHAPTFITPVDPKTMTTSDGPSVITLR